MTKKERHQAETGWVMFYVMAKIYYDHVRVETRVLQHYAERGLAQVRQTKSFRPFQSYRKGKP